MLRYIAEIRPTSFNTLHNHSIFSCKVNYKTIILLNLVFLRLSVRQYSTLFPNLVTIPDRSRWDTVHHELIFWMSLFHLLYCKLSSKRGIVKKERVNWFIFSLWKCHWNKAFCNANVLPSPQSIPAASLVVRRINRLRTNALKVKKVYQLKFSWWALSDLVLVPTCWSHARHVVTCTCLCFCSQVISVDGKTFPFSCNSTITYTPDEKQQSRVLSETVQVSAVDISHPHQTDTLKIDMTTSIQRGMWRHRMLLWHFVSF